MAVTVRPGAGPVNGGRPARRSASRSAWAPTIAAMSRFARGLMGFPVLGAVLGLVLFAVGAVFGSALRQVFAVVLYRFTTSGHAPEGFSEEDLRSAVRARGSVATA
jgi:hypothetical protein